MSDSLVPPAAAAPTEEAPANIGRGALLALITVPVGVAVWVAIWSMGFIASIVAAGIAFLAVRLYLWGAGRITRPGAVVVLVTTVVTLLLALFAGIVADAAQGFGEASGLGAWGAFAHADFWPMFWEVVPPVVPEYYPDFAWAIGFGALGSFATLRAAFAAAREADDVAASPAQTPSAPEQESSLAAEPTATPEPESAPEQA